MILSSFLSSWNLLSSKGLDKDIEELFIGSHMGNHNVSLYDVVSQKWCSISMCLVLECSLDEE
jgi:hypothetical protein